MENKILIDSVNNLKVALNEISVYDFDVHTSMELYYEIAKNFNNVIKELNRFEGVISDEVIKQNEKLIYLLGEGLNIEVVNKINEMVEKGIFDTIINHNIFNNLKNDINNVSSQLEQNMNNINEQFNTIDSDLTTLKNANNVYGVNIQDYADIGLVLNNIIKNTDIPVIYIPKGTYNSSVEITIDRPIKIIGENSWYTEDETGTHSLMPYISFSSSKGFNITVPNVRVENVSVRAVDYGFFAEYHRENGSIRSIYNIQLENCTSEHCKEADFYIGMTVQCEIKHCVALGGKIGFKFEGGQNTSTLVENCWARNVIETGYYCASMTYCTFINCCCDIAQTGFIVSACKGVSFIGCGSELVNQMMHITSCKGITVIEPFGAFNGNENIPLTDRGSLMNIWYSKDITITGGNNVEYYGTYDITCHAMTDNDVPILIGGTDLRTNFFKSNTALKQANLIQNISIDGGAGGKDYNVPSDFKKYKVMYTIFINGTVEQTITTIKNAGELVFNLPVGRTCQIIYIPLV